MSKTTATKTNGSKAEAGNGSALTSYSGPRWIGRMRREFEHLFDRYFHDVPALKSDFAGDWRWAFDMEDLKDAVVVRAEAPGFEPGDFDLQICGGQLIVRAAKKTEKEDKERGYHEERSQNLYRFMTLPPGVNADKIEAKYHNGVLTVTVPKTEEGKGRRIAVKGN